MLYNAVVSRIVLEVNRSADDSLDDLDDFVKYAAPIPRAPRHAPLRIVQSRDITNEQHDQTCVCCNTAHARRLRRALSTITAGGVAITAGGMWHRIFLPVSHSEPRSLVTSQRPMTGFPAH